MQDQPTLSAFYSRKAAPNWHYAKQYKHSCPKAQHPRYMLCPSTATRTSRPENSLRHRRQTSQTTQEHRHWLELSCPAHTRIILKSYVQSLPTQRGLCLDSPPHYTNFKTPPFNSQPPFLYLDFRGPGSKTILNKINTPHRLTWMFL